MQSQALSVPVLEFSSNNKQLWREQERDVVTNREGGTTNGEQKIKVMTNSLDSINRFDANLEEIILVGRVFLSRDFFWLQKQGLWEAPSGLVALPTELLKRTCAGQEPHCPG